MSTVDKGESGNFAVETVVLVPVAMILVLLAVQMCLWAHAATLVQNAASIGEQTATASGGSAVMGTDAARQVLASTASEVVTDPQTRVQTLNDDETEITVSATAESIIPWLHLSVSATRVGTDQEFRESG